MAHLMDKVAISCWVFSIQNSPVCEHHVQTSLHTDWRGAQEFLEEIYGAGAVQFEGIVDEDSDSWRSVG